MKNHFDRIQILFLGGDFSSAKIVKIGKQQQRLDEISLEHQENNNLEILGIEIESSAFSTQGLKIVLAKNLSEEIGALYVLVHEYRHVSKIEHLMDELNLEREAVYGVDPGYYYSFVPFAGPNLKSIEQFILDLKSNVDKKGYLKYLLKTCLIKLNLSHVLYEYFVVTAKVAHDQH